MAHYSDVTISISISSSDYAQKFGEDCPKPLSRPPNMDKKGWHFFWRKNVFYLFTKFGRQFESELKMEKNKVLPTVGGPYGLENGPKWAQMQLVACEMPSTSPGKLFITCYWSVGPLRYCHNGPTGPKPGLWDLNKDFGPKWPKMAWMDSKHSFCLYDAQI